MVLALQSNLHFVQKFNNYCFQTCFAIKIVSKEFIFANIEYCKDGTQFLVCSN
jgi:hypothetical protein